MKVAVTGATGFLGHYIVKKMLDVGNPCRCWFRDESRRYPADNGVPLEWVRGELGNERSCELLLEGCDAVVHCGLHRHGTSFRGGEGDVVEFVGKNIVGTVQLIETARRLGVSRFVFISTCAVHERILDDRPLDETHPTWSTSHYGAYKAAIEQFVHSYGFGAGYSICALRPSGIYGLHHEPARSKWYELIHAVAAGRPVECRRGGKEVHAADVAEAVDLVLLAEDVAGEVFSCCDGYVSEHQVATIARDISGADTIIQGSDSAPRHEIVCDKIQTLGLRFGGAARLRETIAQIISY